MSQKELKAIEKLINAEKSKREKLARQLREADLNIRFNEIVKGDDRRRGQKIDKKFYEIINRFDEMVDDRDKRKRQKVDKKFHEIINRFDKMVDDKDKKKRQEIDKKFYETLERFDKLVKQKSETSSKGKKKIIPISEIKKGALVSLEREKDVSKKEKERRITNFFEKPHDPKIIKKNKDFIDKLSKMKNGSKLKRKDGFIIQKDASDTFSIFYPYKSEFKNQIEIKQLITTSNILDYLYMIDTGLYVLDVVSNIPSRII